VARSTFIIIYVPRDLIEETKRHGKALGVEASEVRGSFALSFAGSKPHRLQPPIFDVEGHINAMDRGQVGGRSTAPKRKRR
jgi:hypothetical protein